MAGDNIDDDEYVARLLKQDAVDASKKYNFVGLDAFHPKRLRPDAPKPNTNFLRHIIRQTDSHNAALLAREAKDSRARLRELDTAKGAAEDRMMERRDRLHSPDRRGRRERHRMSGDGHRMSGDGHRMSSDGHRMISDEHREERSHKKSRHERCRSKEDTERRRRHNMEIPDRLAHRSRHRRQHEYRPRRDSEEIAAPRHHERFSRHRTRSRSGPGSRSDRRSTSPASSRHHKISKHHAKSRSYRRRSRSPNERTDEAQSMPAHQSLNSEGESDPLEDIVGPLPPPKQPAVRSRGRGAHKSEGDDINARFSSAYDPAMDKETLSEKSDEWGDAVEAFRDRQRWKQQGAERLKAAGFSDEQVRKWERGDEKNEEDVRWSARGQAREWDRGKTVDADGVVGFKAAWMGE